MELRPPKCSSSHATAMPHNPSGRVEGGMAPMCSNNTNNNLLFILESREGVEQLELDCPNRYAHMINFLLLQTRAY